MKAILIIGLTSLVLAACSSSSSDNKKDPANPNPLDNPTTTQETAQDTTDTSGCNNGTPASSIQGS